MNNEDNVAIYPSRVIPLLKIGSNLDEDVYNGIVSLYRNFMIHTEYFSISDKIIGKYGTYEFNIDNLFMSDKGFLFSRKNELFRDFNFDVTLKDNLFKFSTYTLVLTVFHNMYVNIDDNDDFKTEMHEFNFVLNPGVTLNLKEWFLRLFNEIGNSYVEGWVDFDARVEIVHDKTEIKNLTKIVLSSNDEVNKRDMNITLTATVWEWNGSKYVQKPYDGEINFYQVVDDSYNILGRNAIHDGSMVKTYQQYFYGIDNDLEFVASFDYPLTENSVLSDKLTMPFNPGEMVNFIVHNQTGEKLMDLIFEDIDTGENSMYFENLTDEYNTIQIPKSNLNVNYEITCVTNSYYEMLYDSIGNATGLTFNGQEVILNNKFLEPIL